MGIVAVKRNDESVMKKISKTMYIMPKGPDALHVPKYVPGMCRHMPGGPEAGEDSIRAIQSLASVAWFSMDAGEDYLSISPGSTDLSKVGGLFIDSCKLVR